MRWLIAGDVVAYCLVMWWLIAGVVVSHSWRFGGSLLEMMWLIANDEDEMPHCWSCEGSLLEVYIIAHC